MSEKQQLYTLIDKIDESEYAFILHFLVKLVPEDAILPDEILAFERAEKSYANGETISQNDIIWD